MNCRFVAVKNGEKTPSIIYFTEVPFHPTSQPDYFLASFRDETNVDVKSFLSLNIDDLFKNIKSFLDSNNIILEQCVRPHMTSSFYSTDVDAAIAKHFQL